jgi:hypothetical protein
MTACGSYHAGHVVHWIQWRHAQADEGEIAGVTLVGEKIRITLESGTSLDVWNHDLDAVRTALKSGEPGRLWHRRQHALQIGTRWFNCDPRGRDTGCHPAAAR